MDFKELTNDDEITKLIPNIANELRDTPEKTLACMGLAIHQVNVYFVTFVKLSKEDFTVTVPSHRLLIFTNRLLLELKGCSLVRGRLHMCGVAL